MSPPRRAFKDVSIVPAASADALREAMRLEAVPVKEFDDLPWIMAQESEGKVGVRNQAGSSARGLYQMTKVNWHLFPRGEQSIGNAVEERQGGIRYIRSRYGTAAKARAFWERRHWY